MPLTVPIVGDVLLLRYMLNFQSPTNVIMRLYSNDRTPSETDALTFYTETTAGAPYTAVSLTGSAWTVASGASVGSTATYAQQQFNFSTADTIYGYFVTSGDAPPRVLLWAERFTGGPFALPSAGGTISVVPRISLD